MQSDEKEIKFIQTEKAISFEEIDKIEAEEIHNVNSGGACGHKLTKQYYCDGRWSHVFCAICGAQLTTK